MEWCRRRQPDRLALASGVFDDDAHAALAIVIGEVSERPHPWMRHFHNRRHPVCGSKPEHGHVGWRRHRVTVERDDLKEVARERKAANLCSTAIEDVEQ